MAELCIYRRAHITLTRNTLIIRKVLVTLEDQTLMAFWEVQMLYLFHTFYHK